MIQFVLSLIVAAIFGLGGSIYLAFRKKNKAPLPLTNNQATSENSRLKKTIESLELEIQQQHELILNCVTNYKKLRGEVKTIVIAIQHKTGESTFLKKHRTRASIMEVYDKGLGAIDEIVSE